ncbi:hypothetical protein Dimus_004589, partial [Dionaea muscipula]
MLKGVPIRLTQIVMGLSSRSGFMCPGSCPSSLLGITEFCISMRIISVLIRQPSR